MKAIEKVYQMSMYDFERAVYSAFTYGSLVDHEPSYYVDNDYFFFMSDSDMSFGPKKDNLDLYLQCSAKYPYLMSAPVFLSCVDHLFSLIDLHGDDWVEVRNDYYIRWNSAFAEFGFLHDPWTLKYRG